MSDTLLLALFFSFFSLLLILFCGFIVWLVLGGSKTQSIDETPIFTPLTEAAPTDFVDYMKERNGDNRFTQPEPQGFVRETVSPAVENPYETDPGEIAIM